MTYRFKCTQAGCEEEYNEESGRTFADRLQEHLRAPSPIYNMVSLLDTVSMWTVFPLWVGRHLAITRSNKEAMFIRVKDPSLNRDLGKFQIPHIWNEVLHVTPTFLFKYCPISLLHNGPSPPTPHGRAANIFHIGKYGPLPKEGTSFLGTSLPPLSYINWCHLQYVKFGRYNIFL